MARQTLYLTSLERSVYHASFIVILAGSLGILDPVAMIRKRNRATSLG